MSALLSLVRDLAPAVELGWPGRLFVFVLLVGVPYLALLQPDDRDLLLPPRVALYWTAIVSVWVLAGLTGGILWIEGTALSEVGLHGTSTGAYLGWSAGATAGALGGSFVISRTAARLGLKESRLTYYLMPREPRERRVFLAVSASAGFCEELTYHGFLLAALVAWLESGWLAALVANLAFGILHGYQGQAGVVRAFLMGYVLCLPVVVGAGLWPAVTAHSLVNMLLGFGLWKWMIPAEGREEDTPPGA